jgi:hypothetical protein
MPLEDSGEPQLWLAVSPLSFSSVRVTESPVERTSVRPEASRSWYAISASALSWYKTPVFTMISRLEASSLRVEPPPPFTPTWLSPINALNENVLPGGCPERSPKRLEMTESEFDVGVRAYANPDANSRTELTSERKFDGSYWPSASTGHTYAVGSGVYTSVGLGLGGAEGDRVGAVVGAEVGALRGVAEGSNVGESVGTGVGVIGERVGATEGGSDGADDGKVVGVRVGGNDGMAVGGGVGMTVGFGVSGVGAKVVVGLGVGALVGRAVGSEEGAWVGT